MSKIGRWHERLIVAALMLSACATLPGHEPIQVAVAGIEALAGEDLEPRMLVSSGFRTRMKPRLTTTVSL